MATRAPLWYDELFTFHIARLGQLSDVWSALAEGTDTNPPLCHLVTRLAQRALGPSELATRLPAVFGYWVMCVSLYYFVVRRCTPAHAMAATLFLLASGTYVAAYAARPYGWLLGCCGLALLCWQSAAEGKRRWLALTGLAVSLAFAFTTHYYAFLVLGPFGVGEMVRAWARRRLDLPMGLALAAGPLALVLVLPLALGAQRSMAPFAVSPGWGLMADAYPFLLRAARWPLLAALGLAVAWPLWSHRRGPGHADGSIAPPPPAHEFAAALTLAALPILGVCLGQWVTGVFAARYALPAVLGFAILLGFIVGHRTAGSLPVALVLSAIFLGYFAVAQGREYRRLVQVRADITRAAKHLGRHGDAELPVVVADPFAFMSLVHYAPAPLRQRLVYLSHPEAARRHNSHDPRDWLLGQLGRWVNVPVCDYATFLANHRRFLVCGDSGWLRPNLEADGTRCRPCAVLAGGLPLFEAWPRTTTAGP